MQGRIWIWNDDQGADVTATPILLTGGAGYIGSHTLERLLSAGRDVVVLDNLSNSDRSVINRVESLSGRSVLEFVVADINDRSAVEETLTRHGCGAVIHFAGLKAVGESVAEPLRYYRENVGGALTLLEAMDAAGVETLVFSSSATVYGDPQFLPLTEDHPLSATNPYGRSKLMIEDMLRDICAARPAMRVALLRYFNPCGAHPSGQIGEDPRGVPNNLMPYIAQVASGQREALSVFGTDYDTPDATGVRDYIHVMDLADGHLAALDYLGANPGCHAVNLGTGRGYSVLEMLKGFSRAAARDIPYTVAPRRPGDVASCYADTRLADELLGWRAERTLEDMCEDHWRWQKGLTSVNREN